jgi:hypothetical protein
MTQNQENQKNDYQELIDEVLSVLKGKRASLCKMVLKDLIKHGIDKKSTVN